MNTAASDTSLVRRWTKRIGLTIVVLLVLGQLVFVRHSNPAYPPEQSIFAVEKVPPPVKAIMERSCGNCHSNATRWPWYSYVAPASWIIANDVQHARKAMNFSEWGSYSARRKEEKLEDICEQITNGDMPDFKYVLVHRAARISPGERAAVCQWTEDTRQY